MYPKFLRKIFQQVIPPDDRARFLVEDAVSSAFRFFQDRAFRKEIDFNKMEQIEQDRVFNELEITFLGFLYLLIENTLDYLPDERKDYWNSVKGLIFPRFINWFRELGTKDRHIKTWEKLIDLRLDEYSRGLQETRDIWKEAMKDDRRGASKRLVDETVILGSVVISGMVHIRRGKSSADDPLKKMLGSFMGLMAHEWRKEMK